MGTTDEELERRYGELFANPAVKEVGHARTPNTAEPVDEEGVLDFIKATEPAHAAYLHSVFQNRKLS